MSAEEKRSAKLSPHFSRSPKAGVSIEGYAVHGKNTKMAARALYYNPEIPTTFSTLDKLAAALPKKYKSDFKAFPETQEAYTMQRTVRKRFLRNPYTVTKLVHV